jgi:hypothetical protein
MPEEFEVYRLHESPPGESLTILLYGGSKVGKTWFAGTAGSRAFYINIGEGLETLKSKAFKEKYPDSNPSVVDIRELDQYDPNAFDKVANTIDSAIEQFRDTFDTIVIDDMTSLSAFAINKAMYMNSEGVKPKSRTLATAKATKTVPLPEIQDRGTEQSILIWFLGKYTSICKRLGIHLICLAHERSVYRPPARIGGEPILDRCFPHFTGKDSFAPDVVPAYFDEVWRLYLLGTERQMRTQRNEIYVAGTRHAGNLVEVEKNPTFPSILTKIRGA